MKALFPICVHLSLDIVDRLYQIWQNQGSLSAKIDIRTDTSSYEFAHGKKKLVIFALRHPSNSI